ncbi:MAG TPA: hypothetical protein VN753_02770 [Terracidiphilus sp.]|nr:hypothetical protein [Terracidiphilus sp.]
MSKLKSGIFISFFVVALTAHAADGATSKAELQKLYQQFFQNKDETRLGKLVYWQGVEQQDREGFFRSLGQDFKYRLRDIHFVPLQHDEHLEYTLRGVTYVPALPPVGRMIVTYGGQDNVNDLSTSYLIGAKDGRYYIDLAVKKTH